MLNDAILLKARLELTHLNGELHALHLEEERVKLKRFRLEGDKARVQSLVDLCELAQRLAGKPLERVEPSFRLEDCHGAKLVIVDKPASGAVQQRQKRKPDGLPTIAQMVLAVLEGEDEGMQPRDVLEFIRRKWWSGAQYTVVCSALCRGVADGELHRDGGRYKLNGVARGLA